MRWRDIPKTLYIRGKLWRVVWKSHEDVVWLKERAWGICWHDHKEIHLDDAMKHLPGKLQEIWLHELLHASMPYTGKHRPKGLTPRLEEAFIETVSATMANAINQTGWRKS